MGLGKSGSNLRILELVASFGGERRYYNRSTHVEQEIYSMVRAVFMTPEQISELVALAHEDFALWEELKDRELEIEKRLADAAKQGRDVDDRDAALDPPKLPTMGMLISDLVKKKYGPDAHLHEGSLIMAVRRRARIELGLPV